MSVTVQRSKTRLYKVAKEFNLAHDTLIEFLKKKGHPVKNHMSVIDVEMIELIEKHYKKEKTDAERHARKRKEFDEMDRRRRVDELGFEEGEEETTTAPPSVTESTITPDKAKEETKPDEKQEEPSAPVQAVEVTETTADVETTTATRRKKAKPTEAVDAPVTSEQKETEPAPAEKKASAAARRKKEKAKETVATPETSTPTEQVEETKTVEATVIEPAEEADVTSEVAAPVDSTSEIPVEKAETPELAEQVEAVPPDDKVQKTPAAEKTVETPTETGVPAEKKEVRKKAKKEELDLSIESAVPKMRGLTVKGKIDLDAPKKVEKVEKEKETPPGTTPPETVAKPEEEKPRRKKKKKKKDIPGTPPKEEVLDPEALKRKLAKKGKKPRPREVDQAEVASAIKKTIASMSEFGTASQRAATRKRKRARREEVQLREHELQEKEKSILRIYEYATVSELASLMNVAVGEVISSLIGLGVMASINQRLDMEVIELVASEFGFEVQPHEEYVEEEILEEEDPVESLESRPPIVTIMGHVDHGKTKLLDFIRKSNIVAGESGGITQHIGAYTVTPDSGKRITFLDTPGHEAFTAMRARGAQVTDIVVLVVAADDAVMPQTVEAISHAQAAKVPIVIALNKIDKPEANPDKVKQQLADRGLLVEEWGGKYGCVPISAKEGINIEELLERILLEADILELTANTQREARGTVIEAELDKGKGIVATVLVQKGTLSVGDSFVAGNEFGKVRAMLDERGHRVEHATPSTPVQVLGFNGSPQAGDTIVVVESERRAREIATTRQQIKRESDFRKVRRTTLDDISEQIKIGGVQDLPIVVKGDVDGSVEALSDSLLKISTNEVRIDVIHKGVGAISESDVLLASASNAIIIGFRIRPNLNARKLAESEDVDIRLYEIIYDAIEDVKNALEGMLRPLISEKITATVLVREVFRISRVGSIAGCFVQDGKIHRNSRIRLLRDGIVMFTGSISSLKRFKDDVREVDTGFECGISLDGFNDLKIGDVIEAFEQVEVKRSYEQARK